MSQQIATLIASKPGIMRNSLVSYLRSMARIEPIFVADDSAAAWQIAGTHALDLVIVDADWDESRVVAFVQRIVQVQVSIKLIVLVESVQQQQLFLRHGAHHALLKGLLNEQLRAAILSEQLIQNKEVRK
ncbi:hypothetical protein ANRL1_03373 [Anaerolineae bacterium]|nr:hypothetical protein ANRL1_03373 [Anaerolineae bacterium]